MACSTVTAYSAPCTPSCGGISSVTIPGEGTSTISIGVLPESSSFNSVMTYDKATNTAYWTTTINLTIGHMSQLATQLADQLSGSVGTDFTLNLANGYVVSVPDCYVQTSTFTHGAKLADGSTGVMVLQSVTKTAPTVTAPNVG